MPETKPTVTVFFPVFHDEHTVRRVAEKALQVLSEVASEGELIIVDDGSPDRSGEIADALAREDPRVRVIHHEENRGYGAALKSGFSAARFEWICATDGDDQYDVLDLRKLIQLADFYDLVVTFRFVKPYKGFRVLVSFVYNALIRLLFGTPYRDVSTGLRLVRRSVVDSLALESPSPFLGAELAIKATRAGYRIGEVGIESFPRAFGRGESVSVPNILATIRDLARTWRELRAAPLPARPAP